MSKKQPKSAHLKRNTFLDSLGWVGISFVLVAFILTTLKVITAGDILYGALNAFGAIGIIASSVVKKDFQPVVLNVVWLIVAVFGLVRALFLA